MNGEILHDGATGQAIVASTGTPVDTILEALQAGDSHADLLRAHPGLSASDIVAAVRFARGAVQRGVRYPTADEMPRRSGSLVRETAAPYQAEVTIAGTLRSVERKRERLAYDLDLIDSISDGLRQIEAGHGIPHDQAAAYLREQFPG
ncbi:DUF433 domain-containing protein [Longimicrobium sp.]|uniref:DUF433 domain-containing protein n=1 Tax=Longimicrobium sp. TaxID=2029185 RepID=UPI003B3B9EE5